MADPAFIQMLQTTQTTNYLAAAGGALVAYDQVLSLSQEVDHIWNRQWSFMTALYLIARYSGTLSMIGIAAWGLYINWVYPGYVNINLLVNWTGNIFLLAIQAILAIRVYALFNQSKKFLIFLATVYVLQATAVFVMAGLSLNNQAIVNYIIGISPAIDSVEPLVDINPSAFFFPVQDGTVLSAAFDGVLLFFALWAFVRHGMEAKRLKGKWSINVLVRTLVADHLLYFVCNLTWVLLGLATNYFRATEDSVLGELLDYVLSIFSGLVVVAGSRMVISLRVIEMKTNRESGTLEGELSTIRFGLGALPSTQSESVIAEGGGF
ncbi:hypothetical protein BJ138DRAFT_1164355 [Hygrophoropsis aurantiaca]|uniref:Uncharacterized protein n=1 Tax=Hygrophoropsis aurantiaca TaxID=72124 RepID=A0ACB7ZWM5_9AGAM|nr:hypothetical protein BJ138DRAFT_1164355 [Hygrophoropsis aurantiaca]